MKQATLLFTVLLGEILIVNGYSPCEVQNFTVQPNFDIDQVRNFARIILQGPVVRTCTKFKSGHKSLASILIQHFYVIDCNA